MQLSTSEKNDVTKFAESLHSLRKSSRDQIELSAQIIRLYRKFLSSSVYNPRVGLVRNLYKSKKDSLLAHSCQFYNLSETLELTSLDNTPQDMGVSARIILRSLSSSGKWPEVIELIQQVKNHNLECFSDIKAEAIQSFNFKQTDSVVVDNPKELPKSASRAALMNNLKLLILYILFIIVLIVFGLSSFNKAQEFLDRIMLTTTIGFLAWVSLVLIFVFSIALNIILFVAASAILWVWKSKINNSIKRWNNLVSYQKFVNRLNTLE